MSGLLARLPGIGDKSAMRLALAMVRAKPDYLQALAQAIESVHAQLSQCRECCDFTSVEICSRCSDARRDHSTICVVAQPQDRIAIERTGVFRGVYHVLHGVLDPLGGVGPADLRIDSLLARLESKPERTPVEEIIVATSPNVEGDATALYLSKLIGPLGVQVSRIASGVAVGGELEYADVTTLHRALEDRRRL
ncbi:MAG: recombination mediator RecR [Deltaproteobacteria bacterium]|nr:recombination mediator RecR [Deltaproteobacteria bacterium]